MLAYLYSKPLQLVFVLILVLFILKPTFTWLTRLVLLWTKVHLTCSWNDWTMITTVSSLIVFIASFILVYFSKITCFMFLNFGEWSSSNNAPVSAKNTSLLCQEFDAKWLVCLWESLWSSWVFFLLNFNPLGFIPILGVHMSIIASMIFFLHLLMVLWILFLTFEIKTINTKLTTN